MSKLGSVRLVSWLFWFLGYLCASVPESDPRVFGSGCMFCFWSLSIFSGHVVDGWLQAWIILQFSLRISGGTRVSDSFESGLVSWWT